jgi:cytidine deaminase
MLPPEDVRALCAAMGISTEALAVALLPLALAFARPDISGFRVGAVAVALIGRDAASGDVRQDEIALFLGANLEFRGLPLHHTIHAEQAAVAGAWNGGACRLQALAVSAPPCGSCRQFLQETVGDRHQDLEILVPVAHGGYRRRRLGSLIPEAFGPNEMRVGGGLFERAPLGKRGASVPATAPVAADPLVRAALTAAARAYAPYTDNLAGCALRLAGGRVITGGSLESAAFNPGLTAVQTALAQALLCGGRLPDDIVGAALAERPTAAAQNTDAEDLFATWAPQAELTIHYF